EAAIRKEIIEKLSEANAKTMEEINQLVYLEAALKETLRLHPSVPIEPKHTLHDATLSDGTFIPAGSTVSLSNYGMARMSQVWGPDAEEFRPERWLDPTTGKLITVSAYKFSSFNAGPRLCLGKNLAMLEMKLVVVGLLSRFHLEVLNPESVTYDLSLTLPVKGSLNVTISRTSLPRTQAPTMLAVDRLNDRFLLNIAVATLSGLVVLPLAWRLLAASSRNDDRDQPHGSRKVLRPSSTLPLIGNTLDAIRFLPIRHDWITSLCLEAKGEPVLLRSLGTQDLTLLSTPQAFEDVFKKQFDNFPKGPKKGEYLRELLGEGIFAVDGDKWYRQRKIASNLFTMRALRDSMTSTIRRHLIVLEKIFHRASETNNTVDLFRLFNRFTMEAFTEIGFGVHMNCLESDKEHPFQTAFDRSQQCLLLRFIRPSWFWKIQRWLGMGMEGQLQRDMDVINTTILNIVTKTLQHYATGAAKSNDKADRDIVSLFLDALSSSSGADESYFDPTYLRDIVVNFIIAGRDTTAQALSWFFYCLNQNPQVEEKIRQEISSKLPNLRQGECSPSMDDVSELVYVEAALKETLRLYPSVPSVSKEAVHDTVLSDGTFIAAGTLAALPMYALGRMPHVWGPDATEFKPERWIDPSTRKIISVSAYQFIAFNAGPRLCLGKNLAMLEMKLIVASLLSKYHVKLESPKDVTYSISLTLPMKGQLNAKISVTS
ncbi:hypothetical protein BBO99_00009391, partial [Phytophthora kernoviae]